MVPGSACGLSRRNAAANFSRCDGRTSTSSPTSGRFLASSSRTRPLAPLASCVLQAGVDLPSPAVRHQIAEAIQLVLQLTRHRGVRRVSEAVRLVRYVPETDRYDVETLVVNEQQPG